MKNLKFLISSDDCAIVHAIYKEGSLRNAANALNLDIAGVSRKVQRISEQHQVLEKVNGKWNITNKGLNLVNWLNRSIKEQENALGLRPTLKLASTPWLAEKVIIPNLSAFLKTSNHTAKLALLTPSKSFEAALLEREVDFVIACHPPNNPVVAHKKIAQEKWISIVPYKWKKDIEKVSNLKDVLSSKIFIRHESINYNLIYPNGHELIGDNEITVNQLSSIRSAVLNEIGWACCPKLLVEEQLKSKMILEINLPVQINNDLCIWWLRERRDIKKDMTQIYNWIKECI